jgi:branched-chain amino acid transport system substrate-binding protein
VRKYLNTRKVPHLFVAGGDAAWGDYKAYPWTMGWGGSHQMEGRLYARHILANRPIAKIAILSLNDDYGRDYVKGFKEGLGARASSMIVGEQTYEYSDPTVDSQIITLKASGADTYFAAAAGKHASQAYRKIYDIGWRPQVYIAVAGASPHGILNPAGLHTAVGFITGYYGKSPESPGIRSDPAMQDYFAWAKQWFPQGDAEDGIVTYGYQVAQALEYVLRACGDDLTRENVMRVATHMDHVALPMLYPGITATTSPTDHFPLEQFQMFRFDGKDWLPFGPVEGQ